MLIVIQIKISTFYMFLLQLARNLIELWLFRWQVGGFLRVLRFIQQETDRHDIL